MSDFAVGSEFAGYRIGEVIGRGGMGVVYRALDQSLERPVAIKLIADDLSEDPALRERFKREARLMAAIDHPNVIPVYAAGEHDGHLYLVMRWVDGTDLQRVLNSRGHLPAEESVKIVDQVGRALDAAHQRGLVHRDIKPANVLLDGDHVYLTDFGITRMVDAHTRSTDTGKWVGTLDYMAPEHMRADPVDGLSDVYSLACLLYTCLTGTPPFHRDAPAAMITAHLHERPPKVSQVADVPRQFDAVIARGLAKRPKDRFPTAGELVTAARLAARPQRGRTALFSGLRRSVREAEHTGGVGPIAQAAPSPSESHQPARITAPEDATLVAGEQATSVARTEVARTMILGPRPPQWRRAGKDRSARRYAAVTAVIALLAAVIVVAVLLLSSDKPSPRPGPLTVSALKVAVHRFATDYSRRDGRALSHLLAAHVTRVDLGQTEHGRAAVLHEYEQQFKTKPVPSKYVLSHLTFTAGWAGRAQGSYTLTLHGGGKLTGEVVFGLERVGSSVQIGLVATR